MTNHTLHSRCARAALAAALAISTTPLLAQEAGTDPLAPTPPVETPAEEPAAAIPSAEPVASAPAPVEERAVEPSTTAAPVARSARPRAVARTASPAPAPAARVASAQAAPLPSESAAQPALAMPAPLTPAPAPLPSEPAAADTATMIEPDEGALWAAAGALALFGLGGAALVGRRRRHARLAEPAVASWGEPPRAKTVRPGGFVTTAAAAPAAERPGRPAFAWGNQAPQPAPAPVADGNRIAAAYRGPTPDNPSLSLKKRLKRAAFFEQRDRAVRAGKAAPVSPHAGLPRRLAENVRTAMRPAASHSRPALQPA